MSEIEQAISTTEETPYRLCSVDLGDYTLQESNLLPVKSSEKIFSATWDPNNGNRIFICTQNGKLYVYDFETKKLSCFKVLFQSYPSGTKSILYEEPISEKAINYHWDKICIIPDRPNEIVFLLGVSRVVMYTSLPLEDAIKSESIDSFPLNRTVFDRNVTDFIYGNQILQILSHKSRVICMQCSKEILSTGDDTGILKLLSLQVINQIAQGSDSSYAKQFVNQSNQSPVFRLSYKIHDGPIFSMEWLADQFSILKNESKRILITGSSDGSVKLSSVTFNHEVGIHFCPMITLTLITANVLCIASLLYFDHDIELENKRKYLINSSAEEKILSPESFYITAGTHLGTIYVWRLNKSEILKLMESPERALEVDDGRYIHSILASWDRPVITLSLGVSTLSSMGIKDEKISAPRVVLSFSDTTTCVKFHFESNRQKDIKAIQGWRGGFGPITFFRETNCSDLVVHSAFLPQVISPSSSITISSRLFYVTVSGKISTLYF